MKNVDILVGGQYGSEGKGVIAAYLANEYSAHVRVGGPNAGHTFIHKGTKYKMQSIPCGWSNPNAELLIGAGGMIDIENLQKEINMIEAAGATVKNRLLIDKHCGVLDVAFKDAEGGVDGEIHQRIGSTGEGVGAARSARLNRKVGTFRFAKDVPELQPYLTESVSKIINNFNDDKLPVLLEGTQGAELSLIHCDQWPYCTSADTNAAQMLADCGISPLIVRNIIMVVRTYPIRVAGNSGPLKGETTWADLSRKIGKNVIEKTTVTKKIRRVGEWDEDLFLKAMRINQPNMLALNFLDYIDPNITGMHEFDDLSPMAKDYVAKIENLFGSPIMFIGTGGSTFAVIDRRKKIDY